LSRKTPQDMTLIQAFFDDNIESEEYYKLQQQYLQSSEKQSPWTGKRGSSQSHSKNGSVQKLRNSRSGIKDAPRKSVVKTSSNKVPSTTKRDKSANFGRKSIRKSVTMKSSNKQTDTQPMGQSCIFPDEKKSYTLEISPQKSQKSQKPKYGNSTTPNKRLSTSKNFDFPDPIKKNLTQNDDFTNAPQPPKIQKTNSTTKSSNSITALHPPTTQPKNRSSTNLKRSKNSAQSTQCGQPPSQGCHDSIKTGKTLSTNMNSYYSDFSEKNVRPHVRDFYSKILGVVEGGQLKTSVNVGELQALIYHQLEDLVIPFEELEFED
jgi:hypothetical protein